MPLPSRRTTVLRRSPEDGYYVTKQPSPKELEEKVTFEDARAREIAFFETAEPWSSKSHLRNRMGTPNLTAELSRLLGNVINQAYVPCNCLFRAQVTVASYQTPRPAEAVEGVSHLGYTDVGRDAPATLRESRCRTTAHNNGVHGRDRARHSR